MVPGDEVMFTVAVNGDLPVYQWRKDGIDITDLPGAFAGATTDSLTVIDAKDEGVYTVVVSNAVSEATSNNANLQLGELNTCLCENTYCSTSIYSPPPHPPPQEETVYFFFVPEIILWRLAPMHACATGLSACMISLCSARFTRYPYMYILQIQYTSFQVGAC